MKKFSALLICLLMIITCGLAGCASFSINKVKYYNEVLATVDETKITRFDLLNAYNSYGKSYYVQQMGQSESSALKSTLDLLIDRELIYQYALDAGDEYKPSPYQVNTAIQEIFDSLDSQMDSYVESAKTILNIETDETEEETASDETAYKLEDYTYKPRAKVVSKVVNGEVEYNIEYILPEETTSYNKLIDETYLTDFTSSKAVEQIQINYLKHFSSELERTEGKNSTVLYNKSISLFAKNLIDYEYYLRDSNGKKYSTDTNSLLERYFDRNFKSKIQSLYLDNIRTQHLERPGNLSIELLEQEYSYLATLNYNTYNNNHESYKTKMKDIGTKGDTVLYHPSTDTQFGYFIHTLFSFDDIKENLKLLENEKDLERYETRYNQLIAGLKVKARDAETGLIEEDAEEVGIKDVIDEYNEIQNLATYEEKLTAFVQFMFKYTTDTATLSAGMPYVVGTNGYSAMVEEFNNEAIKLMEGEAGNMSTASITDIENLCITEYGIHLLFYVGDVNSFDIPYESKITIDPAPSDYIVKEYLDENDKVQTYTEINLYNKVINPLTEKTYFDMMFDLVYPASSGEVYTSNNGYTDYEEQITETSKKEHKVTKYTTKIKGTKTSL